MQIKIPPAEAGRGLTLFSIANRYYVSTGFINKGLRNHKKVAENHHISEAQG